jgi:hypothetical protein
MVKAQSRGFMGLQCKRFDSWRNIAITLIDPARRIGPPLNEGDGRLLRPSRIR